MSEAENEIDERTDALIAACLAEVEESGPDAIERFCREHPELAQVVRRRFELLQQAGLLEDRDAEPALPARFGEYRVDARLGGGGMGVVYRARQEDLDRDVAIKTIRPELLHFRDARARFRREVETVAKLSHPGIVPVFGSGEQDGVPWFAMQFIDGASLTQVLDGLRGRDPASLRATDLRASLIEQAGSEFAEPSPLFEGSWVDACIALGRDVAAALDHAHRGGVLHRDVKPSNLLLGVDGQVRLFDFGLARPDGDEAGGDEIALTRTGAMVGSLPYMAPEQVRGGGVDLRTDVYGLAATLVELLTLAPPSEERDPERLRAAIVDGHPARWQTRNRALPRDLVVVLAKALEPDPVRRYATATEFAADLAAVAESRPILARPAGPVAQLRRWARRRPARAVAVMAGMVFLVAAPIVLAVTNARISTALERAEGRFQDAYDSIIHLSATIADEDLRDVPGVGPIRAKVLRRSLELFDRLVQDRPDDDAILLQRALLQRQSASVFAELGEHEEAKRLHAASEQYLRARIERDPDDGLNASELVDLLVDRSLQVPTEPSLALLDEALALMPRVDADERVGASVAMTMRRQALHNRSIRLRRLRRADEALECGREALRAAKRLVALSPEGDGGARVALGSSHSMLATLFADRRDHEGAQAEFTAGLKVLEQLVADSPRPKHRFRLGLLLTNMVWLDRRLDRGEDAESHAARAVEIFEELCREQPWRRRYRERLSRAYDAMIGALLLQGRAADAVPWSRRSLEVVQTLVALNPGDERLRLDLAVTSHNCAASLIELGRRAEARRFSDIAVQETTRLRDQNLHRAAKLYWPSFRFLQVRTRLGGDEALPTVEELTRIWQAEPEPDADTCYQFAGCVADVAAFAAATDREPYCELMVRALGAGVDAGFAEGHRVDDAPVFDPWRERADFAAVRERMK